MEQLLDPVLLPDTVHVRYLVLRDGGEVEVNLKQTEVKYPMEFLRFLRTRGAVCYSCAPVISPSLLHEAGIPR